MDPRLLLDPKAALKKRKAGKTELPSSASSSTIKRASQSQTQEDFIKVNSSNAHSKIPSSKPPPRPRPAFDPRALLDPRNHHKALITSEARSKPKMKAGDSVETHDTTNTTDDAPYSFDLNDPFLGGNGDAGTYVNGDSPPTNIKSEPYAPPRLQQQASSGGKRMLEGLYGVEKRSEQSNARKRVKSDEDGGPSKQKKFSSSGTGIVADYMNPAKDPNAEEKPTIPPSAIDLTNDDDDDDLEITGSNPVAEKIVCYGSIHETVDAFLTPKPMSKNHSSMVNLQGFWPPIDCTVRRDPEDKQTNVVRVFDGWNCEFARCNLKLAKVLAPVMDRYPGFRLTARLLNRARQPNEWPHQPFSEKLRIMLVVYGRKCDAEQIGRLFGHHNIWLQNTQFVDKGCELHNPQKQESVQRPLVKETTYTGVTRGGTYNPLSDEDAMQTVTQIFQQFKSDELPETEAPSNVRTPLLPHQKQALTFMLRRESPPDYGEDGSANSSLWRKRYHRNGQVYYEEAVSQTTIDTTPPESLGGLLADVMGLGKTLESLTLVAATLPDAVEFAQTSPLPGQQRLVKTKATLIVCPLSTVANWEEQIKEHLVNFSSYTHHGPNRYREPRKLCNHDIVITTYGTLQGERKREAVLHNVEWFRIILDEAHTIRESANQQSQACFKLDSKRRWALTGTPIQNKLADLGSLCQFLKLFPYQTVANFNLYIGKRVGSGDPGFLMKLRVFIDSFTLRRLRDKINLPPKEDVTLSVEFSDEEMKLHEFFRVRASIAVNEMTKEEGPKKQKLQISVLQGITLLRLISAHGREMLRDKDLDLYRGANKNEPINVDEDDTIKTIAKLEAYELFKTMDDADFNTCKACEKRIGSDSPGSDNAVRGYMLPCQELFCPECFTKWKGFYDSQHDDSPLQCPSCSTLTAAHYVAIEGSVQDTIETLQKSRESTPIGSKTTYGGPHSKTLALLEDIAAMTKESEAYEGKGEKPLKGIVFSEFTSHLSLIDRALKDKGYRTVRIDGSMSLNQRKKVLRSLSEVDSVTILLASIKAAGQGLNLTAASRAFIMEPLWNPAAEAQAVDRVYRIGQERPVIVKRYHMRESIEETIIQLADKKRKLADLSLNRNHEMLSKKEQREAHYNEIRALFDTKRRH